MSEGGTKEAGVHATKNNQQWEANWSRLCSPTFASYDQMKKILVHSFFEKSSITYVNLAPSDLQQVTKNETRL